MASNWNQLTQTLAEYAAQRIEALGLGENGSLGTEFVVAYDDAGPNRVRISDGHHTDICGSREAVDASLQGWVDWINEDA
jgi:hypothetical protein